jgi:enoyl-CoA hydratase
MSSPAAALTLENLIYEKKGVIAYVTLNRPQVLNALNRATWEDLRAAFGRAGRRRGAGVILTGGGDKAFIAARTSESWSG